MSRLLALTSILCILWSGCAGAPEAPDSEGPSASVSGVESTPTPTNPSTSKPPPPPSPTSGRVENQLEAAQRLADLLEEEQGEKGGKKSESLDDLLRQLKRPGDE